MEEITTSDTIKWLAIGGILLWLITRKRDIQPINDLQQSSLIGQQEQRQTNIYGWRPLDHIPNFEDFNSKITQTIVQPVEQKVPQIVQQDSPVAEQVSDSPVIESKQELNSATEYGNKETWKILRNSDGDIEIIEVQRSARVDVRK